MTVSLGDHSIRSVVIAGGGTAGWMAAVMLARRLERLPVTITLVESPEIGAVGVGEATVPAIRDFHRDIGVSDMDVMRATGGTAKLGIAFEDWLRPGHRFFHPFGLYGSRSRGVQFHQYWLKLRAEGLEAPIGDFSLAVALADAGRFATPPEQPATDLQVYDWAMHFDAGRYARFLRSLAEDLGVQRIDGTIVEAQRDCEIGHVSALRLRDGKTVSGDLFLDCTGFRALLIGGAMEQGYQDWSHLLPCDRAVAIPCARTAPLTPYTRSRAKVAGWQWRIPLQHRVGNGYVYASKHISDDEAVASLQGDLEGEALAEPNLLRFVTGHRKRFWHGNVVALGLAAGFMEPLESTSIVLIQTGIERLIELFPDRDFAPELADDYNRRAELEWARIRDFLLLHYWANRRMGEPMWDAVRAVELPEPLRRKIALFRARGNFIRYEWETFQDPSWLSMYAGFELLPGTHDPLADHFAVAELNAALARMRDTVARHIAAARPHAEWVSANCAASS